MDNLQTLYAVMAVFSFAFGATVGSFLNVCVYRLPRGLSVVKPRSKCPKCESLIAWHDNIPIVSWLVLGAKCRNCGQPISWQYPLVEFITAVLFALTFWRHGFTAATPIYMLLAAALVLVTFVDLTDWTIPNEITFPGAPLGLGCAVLAMFYPESGLYYEGEMLPVFNSLLGAVLGFGLLYGLDKISLILLKKRGMGMGDAKLLAMLGAFFGWIGVIVIIMISSIIGALVGGLLILLDKMSPLPAEDEQEARETAGGHYIPFGPYIALAGVLWMLFGESLFNWYMSVTAVALTPTGF